MTFLLTKTVIVAAIIIFAAVAALMCSLLAYSSKSKSDYERAMDDEEQIEYLRALNKKAAAK